MAKMSKKQLNHIASIIDDLQRVKKFLYRDDIAICDTRMPNALSFYNKDGVGITPLTKNIGSDMVLIHRAIERLVDLFDSGL